MTFDTEQIRQEEFSAAIQNSYAEYGVSSNARAIPDARDGLKPVQRRILWFMYRMGWDASHETVKSAEVVGTVMGQAHPHGQEAIYDAAVRLAGEGDVVEAHRAFSRPELEAGEAHDLEIAAERQLEAALELVALDGRQEADGAEVDPEHGDVAARVGA